jgi:hypothetical protein
MIMMYGLGHCQMVPLLPVCSLSSAKLPVEPIASSVVINLQNASRSVTFSLADVGLTSATAQNLITGSSLGKLTTSYVVYLCVIRPDHPTNFP